MKPPWVNVMLVLLGLVYFIFYFLINSGLKHTNL
uniref:Hypotheticial protein n=1 Tax=Schistosoma japonicum TaxID=6182 RepID=C1L9Y2_SCHJA|nr:hypotheticial protein [Schistosoma japonicum]